MSELMKSVSGIRGVFGDGINPENVLRFAAHFGQMQSKNHNANPTTIVIGRDSRTTGEALVNAAIAGLLGVGVDVIYLGIVATPTLLLSVQHHKAQGGICITASHNPAQWNAMKFIDANGMFLYPEVMAKYLQLIDSTNSINYTYYEKIGQKTDDFEASWRHIQKILAIPYLDIEKIRAKHFKVALDSVNGAGGVISPTLLKELGCEVIEINSEPTGLFAHNPEPLAKNLAQICDTVKQNKANIGFATDPDVDRLVIIDENGNCVGEEFTLLIAEKFVLGHIKGDIVTNLSSSMASDDIAKEYGVNVIRTKVGEINVGKKMLEINSPIGGEGNGGVICPAVNTTRDAITGIALILGYIAQENKTISALVSQIPHYYFAKDKIVLNTDNTTETLMQKAMTLFPEAKKDTTDGIKIIFPKEWAHIRPSGTEPIVRIYVESETIDKANKLCQEIIRLLS